MGRRSLEDETKSTIISNYRLIMKEINKEKTIEKWKSFIGNMGLSDDKKSWLSDYARKSDCLVDSSIHNDPVSGTQSLSEDFPSILPMAMRVAAQTIGQNLVSVQPMISDMSDIMSDVKIENRDRMIDSIVEGKDFEPMKPEDHPDYKKGGYAKGELFYLDYKYNIK